MFISVINRQTRWKLNQSAIRRLAEFLLEKSGKRAKIKWGEVSVVLVDDRESRAVNQAHLGHDYATDVISFNFAPVPGGDQNTQDGEIVINVEQACRLGCRYGGSDHELALYLAHGCDHLSGEDDKTPAQRQRMRRRELRWVKEGLGGQGGKGVRGQGGKGVRDQGSKGLRRKNVLCSLFLPCHPLTPCPLNPFPP